MKKLIAIAVVFALAAGGLFAADLGVTVQGTVNLVEGSTASGDKAVGTGQYLGMSLEGAGENDDGTFGAWFRFSPNQYGYTWAGNGATALEAWSGYAWWKPIDQFKLTIGGNPDGIFPKEGLSAWMFYQRANDSGVVESDAGWGYTAYSIGGDDAIFRNAYYGGFAAPGLLLEIKPLDMFSLNIVLPYFDKGGAELAGVFKNMVIQADLNFDFGNIALTFDMYDRAWGFFNDKIGARIFLFFGLNSIENLDFSFSAGFSLPHDSDMEQVAIGLAAKYAISDAFSIKARVLAQFAGKTYGTNNPFDLVFEVQPGFAINDNVKVFAALGINMQIPNAGDTTFGWHLNPYLWIGQEWGPSFFAGIKLYNDVSAPKSSVIHFAVPIGLNIGF